MENRSDGYTAIEDRYAGYTVYDNDGDKIGKVDDLFLDEQDQPEYIGVKMGFLGTRSTLIPMEIATTDEANGSITVSTDKETVKNGPSFDDDREITPEYENEVYSYYSLTRSSTGESGFYGDEETDEHSGAGTTGSASAGTVGSGMSMGDTESGEFREHDTNDEGVGQSQGDDFADENELRVQRSEEELRAGTREREAGSMRVRKRVRTDRERIEVPTRHEEVSVERVPVSGEATDAQIGEDEVSVPVTEEEVVTDKRAVAKEEIRLRKRVVEDEEVVEVDLRKEEVEIDDRTKHGARGVPREPLGHGSSAREGSREMGSGQSDEVGKRFAGYQIYDQHYKKVGKVDDLLVDENDRPEYLTSVWLYILGPIIGGVLAALLYDRTMAEG